MIIFFCGVQVMEKRLWRDVLKSFNSSASSPHSGALRTLQQYYTKLLLPYECHAKNLSLAECLSRFENSRRESSVGSPSATQEEGAGEGINHTPYTNTSKADESPLDMLTEGRVNGSPVPHSDQPGTRGKHSQPHRVGSQDSGDGAVMNSQESRLSTDQESQQSQDDRMLPPIDQKQSNLNIPEGSQNSVDAYSEDMEPLPDISVQEAESLLGMSPPMYPTPSQPAVPAGPNTPSGQNTPSPSYPPHFPPSNSQRGGDWGAPPPPPPPNFMDMNDMGPLGASPNPPAYPPAYPMDPASGYRPHSSHMQPGYPSHEVPPDFQAMQSTMIRSPYSGGVPYHGMSPHMQIQGHRVPMDSIGYGPFPSPMMPQPSPMEIRRMEELSAAYASPTGMPMPPEWHWQQQQHRSRMLSSLPQHMQTLSPYQRHHMQQHSSSPRPLTPQQASAINAMQHNRSSPGQSLDPTKIHWQDQMHSKAQAVAKAQGRPGTSPKPPHRPEITAENKTLPVKHLEHSSALEGSKRPLPDWSNCVEGTKPQLVKRRRLFSGDCGK